MDDFGLYSKKENYNTSIVFDDSCFDNIKGKTLSAERSQVIESRIMPNLLAELAELKKNKSVISEKKSKVILITLLVV